MLDWSLYPNFSADEFRCSHCGQADMDPAFMGALQALRTACGFPFVISSGYRCPDHPVEQSKDPNAPPGEHTLGKAADVLVYGSWARDLVLRAADFPRLGIDQTGDFEDRFVHLGTATEADGLPSPTIWSY